MTTTQLQGCNQQADLTDSELAAILRQAIPAGPYCAPAPFDSFRLTAVCDLAAGHSGLHASMVAFGSALGEPEPWLLWGGVVREVAWLRECPEPATAEHMGCLLFDGHEGPHHLCPDDCEWTPSWAVSPPDLHASARNGRLSPRVTRHTHQK